MMSLTSLTSLTRNVSWALPAFVWGCGEAPSAGLSGWQEEQPAVDGEPQTNGAGGSAEPTVPGPGSSGGETGAGIEQPPQTAGPDSSAPQASQPDGAIAHPVTATPYDPNVTFEWTETAPTDNDDCLPGVYTGEFSCELDATGGFLPPGLFIGPVSFTLEQSASGEFLEISEGRLEGTWATIIFTADLAGQLDCTTGGFQADAVDGVYTDNLFILGDFVGTLIGNLDRATQQLTGTWSLTPTGTAPCVGTWLVTRQP